MPNFVSQLKQEIARIGRREAKQAQGKVQKGVAELRRAVASIRKVLTAVQKDMAEVKRVTAKTVAAIPPPPAAEEERGWMMGKGIKAMRRRMKLSQSLFAKLLDVSDQSVYIWERKKGKISFRKNTWAEIQKVRGLGAREVRKILEDRGVDVKGKKRGRKPGSAAAEAVGKPAKAKKAVKAGKPADRVKPAKKKAAKAKAKAKAVTAPAPEVAAKA